MRQNANHEMTPMPFAPAIFIGSVISLYLEHINGPFTF
jgi:prepilin signal peptidase PulO-like enzyme (type II secretory pathway)